MGNLENKARDELHTYTSLVPRLPRSGTRTLKLRRCGKPGIFSHVRSGKGRREVDATLIVRGRMRLRTEKGMKVAGNLLHVSSYRASNIIHTECWSIFGWTTPKLLLFCFGPIWLRHAYIEKIPGSPRDTYSHSGRAWEWGCTYTVYTCWQPHSQALSILFCFSIL